MDGGNERASEQGAWGCAVDRARRNQMQPRVAFQCKDQWEVGELRQDNLLQASPPPPPPPTPSFFPLFFSFLSGGRGGDFLGVFFFGSRGRMGFYVLIWKFWRFFPKVFAKLVEFILEKHIYIPIVLEKTNNSFLFSKNKIIYIYIYMELKLETLLSLVGGIMNWDFKLFIYLFICFGGRRGGKGGRKRDLFQLLFVVFLQYE
jgi:hypothetical protein